MLFTCIYIFVAKVKLKPVIYSNNSTTQAKTEGHHSLQLTKCTLICQYITGKVNMLYEYILQCMLFFYLLKP